MVRSALDYQSLARDFSEGDMVSVVRTPNSRGRVTEVYQGIGMVDVKFPTGTIRYPVEDLMRLDQSNAEVAPPKDREASRAPNPERVAKAFARKAIYWASRDRQYRATRGEQDSRSYACPRCGSSLKAMIYKREEGRSQRLYGCSGHECSFLIKPTAIHGCHLNGCDEEAGL